MLESTLLVAAQLPILIRVQDESWLPTLHAEETAAPVGVLELRVLAAPVVARPADEPFGAHWAQVSWSEPNVAEFSVRGGTGRLRIVGDRLEVELGVERHLTTQGRAAGIQFAVSSTLRLMLALLLHLRDGFLVHCSSVVVDERAALFLGDSGAGKTTTARRLGREGAMRIADDTAVLWLLPEPRLEPCRFDCASRLPGRDRVWPVARTYMLRKGSPRPAVGVPEQMQLALWSSALFAPRVGSLLAPRFLDNLTRLARYLPVRTFDAPAGGPLLPTLRHDLGPARYQGTTP